MDENKELKIVFADNAFDDFEGTQEELEALQKEIMEMFSGKSVEEILSLSTPLSDIDPDDLPIELREQIVATLTGESTRTLH
jgi:hypothetical protein